MAGIDISKIKELSSVLGKLAEKIDKKNIKDGQLDANEIKLFNQEGEQLVAKGKISQSEWNKIGNLLCGNSDDSQMMDKIDFEQSHYKSNKKAVAAEVRLQNKTAEQAKTDVPFKIDIIDNTNFSFTFDAGDSAVNVNGIDVYKQLFREFGEGVTFEQFENGFKITVNAQKEINIDTMKNMLAMKSLRAAFRDSSEVPVAVTQFDESNMTYDKYMMTLKADKQLNDAQKNALKIVVESFAQRDNEGNLIKWDSQGFKQFLNEIAGDDSFLNRAEL